MTIEERTKAKEKEEFSIQELTALHKLRGVNSPFGIGYYLGATDQRKIDIDKACKVYEDLLTCSGYYPEVITAELARMRNKLEE